MQGTVRGEAHSLSNLLGSLILTGPSGASVGASLCCALTTRRGSSDHSDHYSTDAGDNYQEMLRSRHPLNHSRVLVSAEGVTKMSHFPGMFTVLTPLDSQ